jgi:hypothetical protein
MRGFLNNLSRNLRAAKTARRAPRRTTLQVEGLEQRDTPAVTYHGVGVLSQVEVQPLYLGSDWQTNPTLLAQTTQFNAYLNTLVKGSYMDMLTNAYGSRTVDSLGNVVPPGTAGGTVTPPIGRGTTSPIDLDQLSIDKTQILTDSQIQDEIRHQINDGRLQSPFNSALPDGNRLYVVFVEPGVAVSMGNDNSIYEFIGYHNDLTYLKPIVSLPANVNYAVIPYSGSSVLGTAHNGILAGFDAFDSMTEVVSHELAESVTDPTINSVGFGWYDAPYGEAHHGENEVGDIVSGQTVYLNGYAVQRIADQNDQAMTPMGATSARPVDFVLRADGTFWVRQEGIGSNSGFVEEATGVASISDQGIDNFAQAMVDVVFTNGTVAEFHAGSGNQYETSPWVYLPIGVGVGHAPNVVGVGTSNPGNVLQAKAGQGVSYVLTANGNLYEYTDFTPRTGSGKTVTLLDSNVRSIDAGTDAHGDNMVAYVRTDWYTRWVFFNGHEYLENYSQSDGYAIRDSGETIDDTGVSHWTPQMIATNVQSMSAGRQGNIAYVTTGGAAFWYSESTNTSTYEASGVAAITAGTDNGGYLLLDMLFANGRLSQADAGGFWTSLYSDVASIGKAHAGVLDFVFSGGLAFTDSLYSTDGLSILASNVTTAA